jgi:hypothetical protein
MSTSSLVVSNSDNSNSGGCHRDQEKWTRIAAAADRLSNHLKSHPLNKKTNTLRVHNYKHLLQTLAEKKSVLDLLKPSKSESIDEESVALHPLPSALDEVSQHPYLDMTIGNNVESSAYAQAVGRMDPPITLDTPNSLTFSTTTSPVPVEHADIATNMLAIDTTEAIEKEKTNNNSAVSSTKSSFSSLSSTDSTVIATHLTPEESTNLNKDVARTILSSADPFIPRATSPPRGQEPKVNKVPTLSMSPSRSAPVSISVAALQAIPPLSPKTSPVPVSVPTSSSPLHVPPQESASATKKMRADDFESLAIIGRGAFGEVRLVRRKDASDREVYGKCLHFEY